MVLIGYFLYDITSPTRRGFSPRDGTSCLLCPYLLISSSDSGEIGGGSMKWGGRSAVFMVVVWPATTTLLCVENYLKTSLTKLNSHHFCTRYS